MTDSDRPATPDSVGPALAALHEAGDSRALRRFAADAARALLDSAPPAARDLVDAADRSLNGVDDGLRRVRDEFSGAATSAGTIGLRHGAANAPALLAAYAECAPDPLDAATHAARYTRLHGRLAGLDASSVESSLVSHLPPHR